MPTATYKRFDVKHGISVNGLPFVDAERNIIVRDLTVQGTSTIVDTRTITSVDPIISLGASGSLYTAESIITGTPGKIKFTAEAFADIAVGDSVKYVLGGGGTLPTGLTSENIYYIISKNADVTSAEYRTVEISSAQAGAAINITTAGAGNQNFTLNPLQDLSQDLGIEFNYVDTTAKKGFFGYKDTTQNFTFLLDTAYSGSTSQSDVGTPVFTGTKSGIEVRNIKLEPTTALTTNIPAVDILQTWNSAGTTFVATNIAITDTLSAATSKVLNVTVGGAQKLMLRKDGALALNSSDHGAVLNIDRGGITDPILIKGIATWNASGTVFSGIELTITDTAYAAGSKLLKLDAGAGQQFFVDITGEIDSAQTWNAAGTVFTGIDLQVTETAFAAGSKLVNFYASATRYFSVDAYGKIDNEVEFTGGGSQTALRIDVTNTSSAANSKLLDLQVGASSKFSVDVDGDVITDGGLEVNGSGSFEDYIDIQAQPNSAGAHEDNTRFQTSYVTIAAGASTATVINTFAKADYVTGKYLVQVKQGVNYHAAEILLLHDGSGAFMTEYAAVYNSSILGVFDAAISGADLNLTFTSTATTVAANALVEVRITRIAMTN